MQDKQFDQFFKDKVGRFEPPVPGHIWENIQQQLDPGPTVVLHKKRRNVWWIQVAAAVVLVVGATVFYINRPTEVVYLTAKKVQEAGERRQNEGIVSTKLKIAETRENAVNNKENSLAVEQVSQVSEVNVIPRQIAQKHHVDTKKTFDVPMSGSEAVEIMHPVMVDEIKTADLVATAIEKAISVQNEMPRQASFVDSVSNEPMKRVKNKKEFAAGDILEYVASSVNPRNEKIVSFASDEEGTIKVAVNFKALKIKL